MITDVRGFSFKDFSVNIIAGPQEVENLHLLVKCLSKCIRCWKWFWEISLRCLSWGAKFTMGIVPERFSSHPYMYFNQSLNIEMMFHMAASLSCVTTVRPALHQLTLPPSTCTSEHGIIVAKLFENDGMVFPKVYHWWSQWFFNALWVRLNQK